MGVDILDSFYHGDIAMNYYKMKAIAFAKVENMIDAGMFLSEIIYGIQKEFGLGETAIRKMYKNIMDKRGVAGGKE